MSEFSTAASDAVLNLLLRHTAYTPSANVDLILYDAAGVEIATGGYARKRLSTTGSFNAPSAAAAGYGNSGDAEYTSNTAQVQFATATGAGYGPVGWFGIQDVDNAILICKSELLGPRKPCVADATADTLTAAAHGLVNGTPVVVRNRDGALPGGLSAATQYYVVNATANTLQLALTVGGAAVDITSVGNGTNVVAASYFKSVVNGEILMFDVGQLVILLD